MKIFAVGWNYPLHNRDGTSVCFRTDCFMKPDTALFRITDRFIFLIFRTKFTRNGSGAENLSPGQNIAENLLTVL